MDKIAAAAIERLEAEKQRRRDEKIAKSEAVLAPLCVVLGVVTDAEAAAEIESAKAREVVRLREAGERREIIFDEPLVLITGVPGCDESFDGEAIAKEDTALRVEDFGARRRVSEALNAVDRPMPNSPAPVSAEEPAELLEEHRIYVQVAPPTENDPAGAIVEGSYSLTEDGVLRVYDVDGNPIGTEHLSPDADAVAAARRVLRGKVGGGDFSRPLDYPPLRLV
jgi:hypothetical protein